MSAGRSHIQESHLRHPLWIPLVALAATAVLSGCRNDQQVARDTGNSTATSSVAHGTVPSGTSLDVTLGTTKGWQVVLKSGRSLAFTTSEAVAARQ